MTGNHRCCRGFMAVFLCLVLAVSLFGCEKNKPDGERDRAGASTTSVSEQLNQQENAASSSEKQLLNAIYRQNRLDAILLNHKNVQRKTVCMNTSGKEVFTAEVYGDRQQYAYHDSKGNISVIRDGSEYGYDADKGRPYMISFYNNSYQNYANNNRNHILYTGYSGEAVIGAYNVGDEYVVRTKVPMSSIDQSVSDFNPGETFSQNDTCIIEYHMIPYLYEITSMDIRIVRNNGDSVNLMQTTVTYDGSAYRAPSSLMRQLRGSGVEQRVIK